MTALQRAVNPHKTNAFLLKKKLCQAVPAPTCLQSALRGESPSSPAELTLD